MTVLSRNSHVFEDLFICLFIYLFIYLFLSLFVYLLIYLFIYLFIYCWQISFQFTIRLAFHEQQDLLQTSSVFNVGIVDTRPLRQNLSLWC